MPPHKHAPKPVTDTSVQSVGKVLQTRPFQPDVNTNQQAPQLQDEPAALTGGFDLTKMQYDFSPPTLPLGRPLQAKLTIGEPNDKYEQEADRVAHDVVQRIHEADNANNGYHPLGQLGKHADAVRRKAILQRETIPDEEDELQMKPLVQRKGVEGSTASMGVEKGINCLIRKNVVQRAEVWDEVNVGFGAKTKLDPEDFAQKLTEGSEEFAALREAANKQTQEHFKTDLQYRSKPKKGGGTSEAYFKDESTFFNMEGHPAMILSNLIFETANAAQSGSFIQVENDYKSGEIMNKSPQDYGFDDLGEKLTQEYAMGDGETRRSIIQERFEWNSFILAKPSFLKVKNEMMKKEQSKQMYEIYFAAFNHMLEMSSFEEYYSEYGHIHRNAVEGVLRKVAEQEKNSKKCYLTTACIEAKGLSDDCEELTVLRKFRDTYLMNKENGALLIATYYKYSPLIVSSIKGREDEEEILEWIYGVIKKCVEAIKIGENEFAYHTYCKMVVKLKDIYLPQVEVSNPYVVGKSS